MKAFKYLLIIKAFNFELEKKYFNEYGFAYFTSILELERWSNHQAQAPVDTAEPMLKQLGLFS